MLVDGPAQQLGQRLCILHGLLRRAAIHAHMANFQTQHLVDGVAGDVLNALPVLLGHGVAGDHPAAAARDDLGEGQILVQILFVDASGRQEGDAAIGRGYGLDQLKAAQGFGGKKLDRFQTHGQGYFNIAGIGAAGHDRHIFLLAIPHDFRVQPGRHNVGSAGIHRAVHLILRKHGACAQNHVGQLGMHAADGFLGRVGAERDLRDGQSAVGQCLAKRYRVGGVFHFDYRHDAGQRQLFDHFHGAFLL